MNYNPPGTGYPPGYTPPVPYKKPIRFNANVVAGGIIIMTALMYVMFLSIYATVGVWGDAIPKTWTYIVDQLIDIIVYVAAFGVGTAFILLVLRMPVKVAFPMRGVDPTTLICSVMIAMGAVRIGQMITSGLYYTMNYVTGYSPLAPDFAAPRGIAANVLYFISIGILPAILEEAMFRGVILQSLRRYGDGFALIVSSVLFGVMHGNLVQAPYTMVVGFVIGYFVLYTGSIWPGVLIHFVNNGSSVVMEWATRNTTAQQDEMIYGILFGGWLVLGLLGVIILRLKKGSLFYVPKSNYPVTEKDKYAVFFSSAGMIVFGIITLLLFIMNTDWWKQLWQQTTM